VGLAEVLYGKFADVRSGQVWRLVTPAIMHGGFIHILFNMWWLKDLGSAVEHRQSTRFLIAFFLITAIASNVLQYVLSGPRFVGMSGVVYALFGYVWIRGRFDPSSGYGMTQTTIVIMIGFFILCWTGLVGPIANWAHTGGLVAGAVWGFVASKVRR
jgi:GlpG protein